MAKGRKSSKKASVRKGKATSPPAEPLILKLPAYIPPSRPILAIQEEEEESSSESELEIYMHTSDEDSGGSEDELEDSEKDLDEEASDNEEPDPLPKKRKRLPLTSKLANKRSISLILSSIFLISFQRKLKTMMIRLTGKLDFSSRFFPLLSFSWPRQDENLQHAMRSFQALCYGMISRIN